MTVSIYSIGTDVKTVEFNTTKYSQPLLVDVANIRDMPSFAKTVEPYSLNFYDITLVQSGEGSFWLDEVEYPLDQNLLLFTTPGQIRRWYVNNLNGICLFFPAEFLLSHFNDPLLLHQLRYFHTHEAPLGLKLTSKQSQNLIERLAVMQREIQQLQPDSDGLLRCIAHEIMININRWYAQLQPDVVSMNLNPIVAKFRQALANYWFRYHNVCEYAAMLGVTPGHLNFLCRQHLNCPASSVIQRHLMAEAKRGLSHSEMDIEQLSEKLGYSSTSYFCRAFKRHTGCTPLQYRKGKVTAAQLQ